MLMPSIFGENLFDEMMDFPWERESSEEGIRFTERTRRT